MAPNIEILKQVSKENLSRAIRLKRGKKILVLDSDLTSTLDLIANFRFLQDLGVERVLRLDNCRWPQASDNLHQCIFMIKSDLKSAKHVCDHINANISSGSKFSYGVLVVPRLLHVIVDLFENEGVYEYVEFLQYAYEMIPLDDITLSLETPSVVPELWIHNDTSCLASIAKSLFNLSGIFGKFHHVVAFGKHSKTIINMIDEFQRIHYKELKAHNRFDSDIPSVIVIDRSLDFLTPLMHSLTYESMLDESEGIKGKSVIMQCKSDKPDSPDSLRHILSGDSVFEKIRHMHFSQVVMHLTSQEKELRKIQNEGACLGIKDMKTFVKKDLSRLQTLKKNLAVHFSAVDSILKNKSFSFKKLIDIQEHIISNTNSKEVISFLENEIAKQSDLRSILRILSISSLCNDGLKDYDSLKRQIVQSFGFRHIMTLFNLEKMNLIKQYSGIEMSAKGMSQVISKVAYPSSLISGSLSPSSGVTVFSSIVKKLIPPTNIDVDVVTKNHSSYVFNGNLTPLVAKLTDDCLQFFTAKNTNSTLVEKKLLDLCQFFGIQDHAFKVDIQGNSYSRGRNALVFVVGGISRAELAALQVIGVNHGFNILCGGTEIINGNKIIDRSIANF